MIVSLPADVAALCKAARVKLSEYGCVGVPPDALAYAIASEKAGPTEEQVRAARVWTSRNQSRAPRGMSAAAWQTTVNLYGGAAGAKWLDSTVSAWNLAATRAMGPGSALAGAAAEVHADLAAIEKVAAAQCSIDPASVHIDGPAKKEPVTATAAPVEERGVAIVLPVPADLAAALAVTGEGATPASEMHLTLAFLGTTATISPEQIAAVQEVLRDWAATQSPITGEISGSGRFCGDENDAHYLSFDSPELAECRAILCEELDAAQSPRVTNHGFTPHITLEYLAKDAPTPAPITARTACTFGRVALWVGNEGHEFPFTAAEAIAARQSIVTARAEKMKRVLRCGSFPIKLDAPRAGAGPEVIASSVIQIARVGAYKGHGAGEFEFTPAIFEQMKANLDRTENHEVPLDYEHGSEALGMPTIYQSGAPAVAWIKELDNRGAAGLFGTVDWVDATAVGYVRSKRYKYFSPAVVFDSIDRVTGKDCGAELVSGGLTNRPFLDGLQQVAARADGGQAHAMSWYGDIDDREDLLECLRCLFTLPNLAPETDIVAALATLEGLAAGDMGASTGVDVASIVGSLRGALRLPALTPATEVLAAVRAALLTPKPETPADDAGATPTAARDAQAGNTTMALPTPPPAAPAAPATPKPGDPATAAAPSAEMVAYKGMMSALAKACGMDDSAAAADVMKAVEAKLAELTKLQGAEAERLRTAAMSDVDMVAASGRWNGADGKIDEEAKADALALRLSNPKSFSRLFPLAAAPAKTAEPAKAALPATTKLSKEITDALGSAIAENGLPPLAADGEASLNAQSGELAAKLMRENQNLSYSAALKQASTTVYAARR